MTEFEKALIEELKKVNENLKDIKDSLSDKYSEIPYALIKIEENLKNIAVTMEMKGCV